MIKHHHREHPEPAADALYAEGFSFEVHRALNLGRDHKAAVKLIDEAANENDVQSPCHSPECSTRGGGGVEVGVARSQSRNRYGAISHLDNLKIHSLLIKETLIFCDEK
ncbi:MAG: hypothetical protein HY695_23805 [Deltaproteobacteria bacterium]|nr:hypothetical protein [Deltaproteobacteria bacterium]